MNISMFPATKVFGVLVHRNLRCIEYRRFIHVIPCKQIQRWANVVLQQEPTCPILTNSWVYEIQPCWRACSTTATTTNQHQFDTHCNGDMINDHSPSMTTQFKIKCTHALVSKVSFSQKSMKTPVTKFRQDTNGIACGWVSRHEGGKSQIIIRTLMWWQIICWTGQHDPQHWP